MNILEFQGKLKEKLLQFVKTPEDLDRPRKRAIIHICRRIKKITGQDIDPEYISKLLYGLKRARRDKFRKINREIFRGLNWDFTQFEKCTFKCVLN